MNADCLFGPEFGSAAYLAEVFDRACRDRVPLSGAFDLTYRCNFRCVHCYGGFPAGPGGSPGGELETARVLDLLSEAAGAGCLMLLLSGGEPLLRDDFVDIYIAARRLGLIVTVFTNASLLTQAHLDAFTDYPPHMVEVSVYGAGEETYERVTGARGSFRRVRRSIEQLVERRIRVGLKTMILRDNVEDVPAIAAYARDLGLRFRSDPLVTPRLDGDPGPLAQRVDALRAVELEFGSEEQRWELARFYERQRVESREERGPSGRMYLCGAGLASFHLDPWGIMRPCLMSTEIAYNTETLGFAGAWQAVTGAVDKAAVRNGERCRDCPFISLCGYCPGLFALEQGSEAGPPEYLCRLGETRFRAIGLEKPKGAYVGAR